MDTPRAGTGAIAECPYSDFSPGRLGDYFRAGARAVLLDDPRAADIWHRLLGPCSPTASSGGGSLFPWDHSLLQIARNHCAGNIDAGDMLRFIPGGFGYIARKLILVPKSDGSIETLPAHFSDFVISQELLRIVWELMTDVLRSTFPAESPLPSYAVSIELLKYPSSFKEVEQIAALLGDTCGKWTRLGMQMDTWKMQAVGLFDLRFVRDGTALASIIPGLRELLRTFNRWMTPFSYKQVPEGRCIIGDPHCDGTKIVTALLSERETLTTEIHTGLGWITLPLNRDRLAIFPSSKIDRGLDIHPTLHRVLVQEHPPVPQSAKRNITLTLTVQPR